MRYLAALLTGAILAGGAQAAPITAYTSIVVAGTSISDAGNVYNRTTNLVPQAPNFPQISNPQPGDETYHEGRFSNGPVWADIVGQQFVDAGKSAINVAYGASLTYVNDTPGTIDELIPDLPQQLLFAKAQAAAFGVRPLVVIESGFNDLFAWAEFRSAVTPADAARNVLAQLVDLIDFGIRDLVVFNVADIGLIPRYALYLPQIAARATAAAAEFNTTLEAGLAALAAPGVNVDLLDLDALFSDLFARPGAYGITDLVNPCVEANMGVSPPVFTPGEFDTAAAVCADATGRAFFDANHPASQVHEALAAAFIETVDPAPIPLPATLPLAAAGLALLLGLGLRRRAV